MNPREKRLLQIFGGALGAVALYYIVSGVFITPARQAKKDFENYSAELNKAELIVAQEPTIASEWNRYVSRTFSFDQSEAYNWFGQALKQTASEFGFEAPDIKKVMNRDAIGQKTGVYTITYEITITAPYAKALDFMRGLYEQPFVSRIADVSIAPDRRAGRDMVKLSFDVSAPVFPQVKADQSRYAASARTMPRDPEIPLAPWHTSLMSNETFALLERRNILRGFEPAPTNQIIVENLDPKLVGLNATFYWDDRVEMETQKGLKPAAQETIVGKGNVVELRGVYADGTEFTQRHTFAPGKAWAYKIPKHTVVEPKIVNVVVDSRAKEEVRFDVTIVGEDGQSKTLPTMVIGPAQKKPLGEFEAREIRVAATYGSGKPHPQKVFKPNTNEQVYLIPEEPVAPTAPVTETVVERPPTDSPPDATMTVTGMLTYRDVQELIVEGPDGRRIIRAGEPGAVDGGMLYAVCPLGGIVYMPQTRHFYLYPRGESFDQRVKLAATSTDQLASAISEWSGR